MLSNCNLIYWYAAFMSNVKLVALSVIVILDTLLQFAPSADAYNVAAAERAEPERVNITLVAAVFVDGPYEPAFDTVSAVTVPLSLIVIANAAALDVRPFGATVAVPSNPTPPLFKLTEDTRTEFCACDS